MASVYWLIGFVILVIIEAATMALTTIWFAGGALAAFLLSLFHVSVEIQLLGFVIVSFVLLIFTRPLALTCLSGRVTRTNADSLIGKEVRVTEEINNQKETGTVMAGGQEWTARSVEDGVIYPPETMVTIHEIQGVKLIVSRHKEEM